MGRAVLQACWPWLVLLVLSVAALHLLIRLNRARLNLGRLRDLHRDQQGAVQSLSFVITSVFFIGFLLFIVQVSQLMIGQMVVEYAAYAAARSAIVWIPARVSLEEAENQISSYGLDPETPALDQVPPSLVEPSDGGVTYRVNEGSPKFNKIASAAVLACMPISPSRDLGLSTAGYEGLSSTVRRAYGGLVPGAEADQVILRRLDNKLAYALTHTTIEVRFFHSNQQPPLPPYAPQSGYGLENIRKPDLPPFVPPETGEFYPNELGWQDPITVTVKHNLALLPGPGSFLFNLFGRSSGPFREIGVSSPGKYTKYYVYPLTAKATLGNEGEKSVIPYVHQILY